MECNKKPTFSESPELADFERVLDILFPSFFTSDENLWDDAQHIYPKDKSLKSREWRDAHKNAFMNMLISYAMVLREEGYLIEKFVPDSVKQRSLAYLQDSFDIHNIFTSLFEMRRNDPCVQYNKDEDLTIAQIVKKIRGSEVFQALSRKEQTSKEMSARSMKEFFKTNAFYKNDVQENSKTKQTTLAGWRLRMVDDDGVGGLM